MKPYATVLAALLSGCTVYTGMGVHSTGIDRPEINLDNPIGIVGFKHEADDNLTMFCEHHSGIPTSEVGYGYNVCGATVGYKLW